MSILPFDQRDGAIWFDGEIVPWKEAKVPCPHPWPALWLLHL